MKDTDPLKQRQNDDPERLLRTRLRSTTPEFEQRFNELRRQLAQEPLARKSSYGWHVWLAPWRIAGVAGVVTACVIAMVAIQSARRAAAHDSSFGELLALNETLESAMPLTDDETRTAVMLLPNTRTP